MSSLWRILVPAIVTCALLVPSLFAAEQPSHVLFSEDFESGMSQRWKPVEFGGATEYTVVREGSNSCLKAVARKTSSSLASDLSLPAPSQAMLRWRWKIDQCPKGGTDSVLKTFDHAARLFVAFDTAIGSPMTINYVWGNVCEVGANFKHPSSNRAQFIALQSGNEKAGQWIAEERDLRADWKTLFGDKPMPRIVGIGVMTDSDGTGTTVMGWYDDIQVVN